MRLCLLLPAILILLCSVPVSGATIHLTDGTVLHGDIREETAAAVTIDSSVGTVVVDRSKIALIDYGSGDQSQVEVETSVARELELSRLESRQQFDMWGLITVYALTLAGDVALGGTFYEGSAIPVVGPFLNAATLNEEDYAGNTEEMKRDRVLFLVSGAAQSLIALDWAITSQRKHSLERRVSFTLDPAHHMAALRIRF